MRPGSETVAAADIRIVPLETERDADLLHRWVTHPRAIYWEMQDASVTDVAHEYAAIAERYGVSFDEDDDDDDPS